jgi:transcriptional regulator with XRE-family HTH domain
MELIKDRLAHIIRAKNLTATQFAEMMQIQPSNVSHLLSGRNKPSLDFLIKLKDVFPEYSFDWIILGKKPITINDRTPIIKEDSFKPIEIFDTIDEGYQDKQENAMVETIISATDSKSIINEPGLSKNIKQIIYVYEDHTFEIYDLRK